MPDHADDLSKERTSEAAIEFDTAITTEDWVDFALYNARGYHKPRRLRSLLVGLAALPIAVMGGALFAWATSRGPSPPLGAFFAGIPDSANGPVLLWLALSTALILGRYGFHDRLLRRRYRNWSLREHGPGPMPFHCRLDATGYTAVNSKGHARKDWSAIARLEETERQFFLVGITGHAAPIPKRGLSAIDQERLRAIVRAHLPDPVGVPELGAPKLPLDAMTEASVLVFYEQTARDRAACTLMSWNTPRRRRRRALMAFAVSLGLALCLVGLDAFGWWLGWHARPRREPFTLALHGFLQTEAAGFLMPSLYAAGLGFALWAAWPWLLRRQALASARLRGDIPVHLAFGTVGLAAATAGTEFRYAWEEVRAVLEGPEHLGLLLPLSVVLPVPKRALDTAGLIVLRSLLAEHTGRT